MDNEIVTLGYEMVKSLGRYWARSSTKKPMEAGCTYFIELEEEPITFYNDRDIHGKVYYKGEVQDIKLNEWLFAPIFDGYTHTPGSYAETRITINCLTPQHIHYELNVSIGTINISLAELYMEMISAASLCNNTDELQAILDLYKAITRDKKDEDNIIKKIVMLDDIMNQAAKDPSRKDFCDYCKQLISEGKANLK